MSTDVTSRPPPCKHFWVLPCMTAHSSILCILADKFRNLHDALVDNSFGESKVSVATLGKIANKFKYIKIAINPALLWA